MLDSWQHTLRFRTPLAELSFPESWLSWPPHWRTGYHAAANMALGLLQGLCAADSGMYSPLQAILLRSASQPPSRLHLKRLSTSDPSGSGQMTTVPKEGRGAPSSPLANEGAFLAMHFLISDDKNLLEIRTSSHLSARSSCLIMEFNSFSQLYL